jgi:U32 family peptidase
VVAVPPHFVKQGAAAVRLLEGGLAVGDSIVIEGASTYLEQEVESLMIERDPVQKAGKGQDVGIRVADRVRENDRVFRVERI